MKKKGLVLLVMGIFVFSWAIYAEAQGDKVIKWKMQVTHPIGYNAATSGVDWAKEMEKLTRGKLKIDIYPPGALCGVNDMITFLQRGTFDAAITYGGFYTGIVPESDLEIGLPMSWQSYDEVWDAMYQRGIGDVIREAYAEKNILWFPTGADN